MTAPQCSAFGHHQIAGVRSCLRADIERYLTKSEFNLQAGNSWKTRASAFLTPELICLALYRVSHYLHLHGFRRTGTAVACLNSVLHKVSISPQSCIGPGCRMPHPGALTFHGTAGRGLTLYSLAICCADTDHLEGKLENGPRLGDNVTVGGHSVLLGPIVVGDDVKVGFSVNLKKDVPASTLVVSPLNRERVVLGQKEFAAS